jgi:hypothetical protein
MLQLVSCVLPWYAQPLLIVLQEYEKVTGKASGQNKEAFRAAMVRTEGNSTEQHKVIGGLLDRGTTSSIQTAGLQQQNTHTSA